MYPDSFISNRIACVSLINDSSIFSPGLNPVILMGLLYFSEKISIKSLNFNEINFGIIVSPDSPYNIEYSIN